jgi:hypothetical protein
LEERAQSLIYANLRAKSGFARDSALTETA